MKTTLLALALLCCAALGYAQTAPTPSATPAASGTKNVGTDRADAPQAPGMQVPGTTPARPARSSKASTGKRRGNQQQIKSGTSAMPKQ